MVGPCPAVIIRDTCNGYEQIAIHEVDRIRRFCAQRQSRNDVIYARSITSHPVYSERDIVNESRLLVVQLESVVDTAPVRKSRRYYDLFRAVHVICFYIKRRIRITISLDAVFCPYVELTAVDRQNTQIFSDAVVFRKDRMIFCSPYYVIGVPA